MYIFSVYFSYFILGSLSHNHPTSILLVQLHYKSAPLTSLRLVASTTSPRLKLEFKDVAPADFLAYEKASTLGILRAAAKSGGKCGAYKVVDYESTPPTLAAVAVWGWELEVRQCIRIVVAKGRRKANEKNKRQ